MHSVNQNHKFSKNHQRASVAGPALQCRNTWVGTCMAYCPIVSLEPVCVCVCTS